MKCIYCQAKMKDGTVPYHIDRNGYHLTIECRQKFVRNVVRHILRKKR